MSAELVAGLGIGGLLTWLWSKRKPSCFHVWQESQAVWPESKAATCALCGERWGRHPDDGWYRTW